MILLLTAANKLANFHFKHNYKLMLLTRKQETSIKPPRTSLTLERQGGSLNSSESECDDMINEQGRDDCRL